MISTPSSTSPEQPIASRTRLALVFGVVLVCAYLLAWGMADMRGWSSRIEEGGLNIQNSALLGLLAAAVGIAAGLAIVWSPAARTARNLGIRVLASSSTRMMLALMLGVAFLFMAKAEIYTLFTALTVGCLGSLFAEVNWAISALRHAGAPAAPHANSIHPGAAAR